MRFHLLIIVLSACTTGVLFRNLHPFQRVQEFYLIYLLSESLYLFLCCVFDPFVLELLQGDKDGYMCILQNVAIYLTSIICWIFHLYYSVYFWLLYSNPVAIYVYCSLFETLIWFHRSMYLFLHKYHAVYLAKTL